MHDPDELEAVLEAEEPDLESVGLFVGVEDSNVGSPAEFNVIAGMLLENPGGGWTPGGGGGKIPGLEQGR